MFLFRSLYEWSQSVSDQDTLKQSIDHLIGALSYVCPSYFEVLLELTGTVKVLQESLKKGGSTDSALSSLLSSSSLSTLAIASQSAITSQMLINSGLLELMVDGVVDFCSEADESEQQVRDSSLGSSQQKRNSVHVNLLPYLLRFLTSCCKEPSITDWMGDEGYRFWFPLLSKLSEGPNDHKTSPPSISSYNRFAIETATVELLCKCVRFHPRNQEQMACLLVDTIGWQDSVSSSNVSNKATSISSFIRQLILQMLLQEETVPICLHVENDLILQTFRGIDFFHKHGWHPRFGAGHSFMLLSAKLSSSLQELAKQFLLPKSEKTVEPISEEKTSKPLGVEGVTDPNDFGLYEGFEFLESVSLAAGLNVKSKRAEKSEAQATKEDNPGAVQNHNQRSNLSCSFYHEVFGDVSLPQSLTLAQLLQSLMDKGFPCGSSFLELNCRTQGETNSQDSLSTAASLPTPLDVFAKQDGLAQLSMHLPCHTVMPPSVNPGSEAQGDKDSSEGRLPSYPTQFPLPLVSLPASVLSAVPAHSLVAFGLFIRLPGYDKVLLQDRLRARYLLRLLLGTKQDGDGGKIAWRFVK